MSRNKRPRKEEAKNSAGEDIDLNMKPAKRQATVYDAVAGIYIKAKQVTLL
jgi:hypothetical protein